MNAMRAALLISTAILLFISPLHAGGKEKGQSRTLRSLSQEESELLAYIREEEKLARDVYITSYEQWRQPVFSNISRSEQSHMNAVARKIDKYQLIDPVIDDSVGSFTNSELAGLYSELVAKSQTSLLDALYVGALIEEIDIIDLQKAIAESTHNDLIRVYENLMRGSRNHLRAFVRQIENLGIAYEAQSMDQAEVDLILDEPMERGGRR